MAAQKREQISNLMGIQKAFHMRWRLDLVHLESQKRFRLITGIFGLVLVSTNKNWELQPWTDCDRHQNKHFWFYNLLKRIWHMAYGIIMYCQQFAACQALGLDRITDRSRPHLFIRCQPPAIPPACSGLEMCGYRHKLHISPSPKAWPQAPPKPAATPASESPQPPPPPTTTAATATRTATSIAATPAATTATATASSSLDGSIKWNLFLFEMQGRAPTIFRRISAVQEDNGSYGWRFFIS